MPERTPLGAPCQYCGSDQTFIEQRLEPAEIGSFSLAGAQLKLSAKAWPYAVCDGCGHVSRGQYASAEENAQLREQRDMMRASADSWRGRAAVAERTIEHARDESITGEGRSSVVLAAVRRNLSGYVTDRTIGTEEGR